MNMVPDNIDAKVKEAFLGKLWLWEKQPEQVKWVFTYLSGLFFQFHQNETFASVTIYFQGGNPEKIEEKPVTRINEPHFLKSVLNMAEKIEI